MGRAAGHGRGGLIGISLASAAVLLGAGQEVAVVTGLASGRTEPAGWPLALVLAALVLFVLVLIALAVGGVLLVRDLFRTK